MNTLQFGFVLASLSLVACSGSDGAPIEFGQAPSAPSASASSSVAPAAPSAAPSAPSAPSTDGGAPSADASPAPSPPARTMPLHCPQQSWGTYSQICVETAEGKAGDVMELDVKLVPSATCGAATDLYGLLKIDPTKFELVNVESHVNCTTRNQIPDTGNPGQDLITWQKFGNGSIAGCNGEIPVGTIDTIKIRIKPGTPPGDYYISWESSEIMSADQACSGFMSHLNSEVRVLP